MFFFPLCMSNLPTWKIILLQLANNHSQGTMTATLKCKRMALDSDIYSLGGIMHLKHRSAIHQYTEKSRKELQ